MSKNIDILTEMVAGGFHEADVKAIGRAEDTYIYAVSKECSKQYTTIYHD
ncbi:MULTISPECIES: hypothetical protein [unclassified Peribacillus]|nr:MULTISPECIES: hypothetical protein [unclassified Peribacillus]MBK5446712.1 hypothetical protein [Peribacillus sp. TH24]MBK5502946.1 hypothetical protein [Peribacillus sp. TH14]WMX58923.1 hypothetical protein RE409_29770 [Peribacillus sp. R9-11]